MTQPGPSEAFPGSVLPGSPAGVFQASHPRGESDLVVMQDYAPAGVALTATEVGRVKLAREYAANGVNVELAKEYLSWLLAIIDRLTASSPAEVSEEELANALGNVIREKHGLRPLRTDEIVGETDWDIHRQQARALLSQFIIGRR